MMMLARSIAAFAAMISLWLAAPNLICAQAKPPDPLSLASQMAKSPPAAGECAIAVGAEHAMPTPGGGAIAGGEQISELASRYGRIIRSFDDVVAVAMPTMTVLNTDFREPNPYDGISTNDAFKLLCATLSDSQWAQLTGKGGLAIGDMTSDEQKSLFKAILGPGSLKVRPLSGDMLDLTADKPLMRLRLVGRTQMLLQSGPNRYSGVANVSATTRPRYYAEHPDSIASDSSQLTLAEFPNVLKRSGLDYASAALQIQIPLGGIKTVDDLVYRIGRMTNTELYVDPHYGSQNLTLVFGPPKPGAPASPPSAKASDLLKALALCVTGTYRQIGPAFGLTDDILGVGTRMQMQLDFEAETANLLKKPLDAASDAINAHHQMTDLHDFSGADIAPTLDQIKAYAKKNPYWRVNDFGDLNLSYSDLTPAQQSEAQKQLQAWQEHPSSIISSGFTPSLANKVDLMVQPMLQFLTPSLPDPIVGADLRSDFFSQSFATREANLAAKNKAQEAAGKAHMANSPPPPGPTLAQVFAKIPHRAVLVNIDKAAEIKSAIVAMRTVGFNELWLTVFADGKARIPGTKLSDPDDKANLIVEAVAAAKGTDITIYPVLDLFKWGSDTAADLQDLTIRGENSATDAKRLPPPSPNAAFRLSPPPTMPDKGVFVCPLSSAARDSLLSVVRAVGASPGIGGVIWRDTSPPGYDWDTDTASQLGYALPARLAFLRTDHADPVDVYETGGNTGLPIWDRGGIATKSYWSKFRANADLALLQDLRAASGTSTAKPVLVLHRGNGSGEDAYSAWDSPSPVPPGFRGPPPPFPDTPAPQPDPLKASMPGALLSLAGDAAQFPRYMPAMLSTFMSGGYGGFVMVFDGSQGADLKDLETLAEKVEANAKESGAKAHG